MSYIEDELFRNRIKHSKDGRIWVYIDFDFCLANSQDICELLSTVWKRARMAGLVMTIAFKGVLGVLEDSDLRGMLNNASNFVIYGQNSIDSSSLLNRSVITYDDYKHILDGFDSYVEVFGSERTRF